MVCESWISNFDDLKKQSQTYLIKTDSLGNEEWRKTFKGKDANSTVIGGEILLTPQNEILVTYGDGDGFYRSWSGDEALTKHDVTLKLFNLQGDLLKEQHYFEPVAKRTITSLTQQNDSTYALLGTMFVPDDSVKLQRYSDSMNTASFVFGFNNNLDSLYEREFIYPFQFVGDANSAFGISSTKDGGLIAAGHLVTDGTATGRNGYQAWYVKLDSIGCTYAGCDTVYNKPLPPDSSVIEPPKIVQRKLYPNPANSNLTLQTFSTPNQKALLYHANGQLLLEQDISETKTEFDISSFSNGLYIFVLLEEGEVSWTEKIVIQH